MKFSGEEVLTPAVVLASSQKALSHSIDTHSKLLHNRMVDERGKARMNSLAMQHAGDWLNMVPVRALGLYLRPREFTVAVKYRLGVRVYPEAGPCIVCGEDSDAYGNHAVRCGKEGERIFRHNVPSRLLLLQPRSSQPSYQGPRPSLLMFSFLVGLMEEMLLWMLLW